MKSFINLLCSIGVILCLTSCAAVKAPDTGITGLTGLCNGKSRPLLDCNAMYSQYLRTVRFDVGVFRAAAVGFGIGAKQLILLDSAVAEHLQKNRDICVQYNNCLISEADYVRETNNIRQDQYKIRKAAGLLNSALYSGSSGSIDNKEENDKEPRKLLFDNLFANVINTLIRDDENETTSVSTTVNAVTVGDDE